MALGVDGLRGEGPQIDCQRQGRWISYGFDEDDPRSSLIEIYKNGERIDYRRRQTPDPAVGAPSAAAGSYVGTCFTSTLRG